MTLGGLALAVGVLVDEATVSIEKHPYTDATRRLPRPRGCSRLRTNRCRPVPLHALRARCVPAIVLYVRGCEATVCSIIAGSGVCNDFILSALQQFCSRVF